MWNLSTESDKKWWHKRHKYEIYVNQTIQLDQEIKKRREVDRWQIFLWIECKRMNFFHLIIYDIIQNKFNIQEDHMRKVTENLLTKVYETVNVVLTISLKYIAFYLSKVI